MKFEHIDEAIEWLQRYLNPKARDGFERLYHALHYVGNPHQALDVIHITGTNGKGSVSAYLTALCRSHDLKVGTFTSPHIMAFNERIALNGTSISDEDLLTLTNEMVALNAYMATTSWGEIMGFELYTVMACVYFARQEVDVALFEVGIGGLHDCTNVLDAPIAVITTIGLDHADKLGNTIQDVATQKSGIIKLHANVVVGKVPNLAQQVIRQHASWQQATVWEYGVDFEEAIVKAMSYQGTQFEYAQHLFDIQLLGHYQVDNACVALKAFELWLEGHQCQMNWQAAQRALHGTRWMARMERVHDKPIIYIDGAHNHAGLEALKASVQQLFVNHDVMIMYAGLTTKDQATQLYDLDQFSAKQLLLTQFDHVHAMTVEQFSHLQQALSLATPTSCVPDWQAWLTQYCEDSSNDDTLLLVTGSLYFVSQVRAWLQTLPS